MKEISSRMSRTSILSFGILYKEDSENLHFNIGNHNADSFNCQGFYTFATFHNLKMSVHPLLEPPVTDKPPEN